MSRIFFHRYLSVLLKGGPLRNTVLDTHHPRIFTSVSSSGFQTSLLLIYFREGPSRCSQCTKVWQKTYPISVPPLSRSERRSFSPSKKSRRKLCSYVWTEFPSGMIFWQAQKLSGILGTYSLYRIGCCCVELLRRISPSSIMRLRRKNRMKKDVQQSFDQQS